MPVKAKRRACVYGIKADAGSMARQATALGVKTLSEEEWLALAGRG